MSEKRSKRLLKDILLFAVASFAPKLLSFFLVPIYTTYLDTETYGIFDLLGTITSLLLPILMLDISDAIMIYTIEKKDAEEANQPLRFGTRILVISSMVLFIALAIIGIIFQKSIKPSYLVYIFVNYIMISLNNNLLAYIRGKNRVNVLVISSIINSAVTLSSNIFFILVVRIGLRGLLIANVIGSLISNIYICSKIHFCKLINETKEPSQQYKHAMLSYSIPLIFTGLAWWINSSSDRFFISIFAGVSINGIYAVANKIPTILSACHSIVYQAMQLSVFKEIHAKDKNEYLKTLYNIYFFAMTFICSCLIMLDRVIANILFKGEFYVAWKYSPALLISTTFFSVAGYLTTIFAAEKETKLITVATVTGAIINSILNLLLIPRYQLYGAVIATLVGYFSIWLLMVLNVRRIVGLQLNIVKGLVCLLLLIMQWLIILNVENYYLIQLFFVTFIVLLNVKTVAIIVTQAVGIIRKLH